QRSPSPVGRDRRRGGSRSRSPYSRSPIPRRTLIVGDEET
ncbi:unnamed protein product, partial [Rotaria magnacalcarata]